MKRIPFGNLTNKESNNLSFFSKELARDYCDFKVSVIKKRNQNEDEKNGYSCKFCGATFKAGCALGTFIY